MAFNPQHVDVVSGEQYRYALTNFRIAHEKVEEQRRQLEEQEKQVAILRARIALLEGNANEETQTTKQGGNSVDDFSIKNSASQLERLINRWAADIVRDPPVPLDDIYSAALSDIMGSFEPLSQGASPMQVQNILRHALSETISSEIINCLIVTNSTDANIQLTRIHEHLFARKYSRHPCMYFASPTTTGNPVVACVWRRQTFSAAVEECSPQMTQAILMDQLPTLVPLLAKSGSMTEFPGISVLDSAYSFSRMLHGASSTSGGSIDAFYRSFVPEIGSTLYPRQIELVRRCLKSERGDVDRVGATIFPGLVKVTRTPTAGRSQDNVQTVVRRAQVICECALASAGNVAPGL
ncbi:hypothetical protein BV22DRAFT_78419 [Leucogyrophana mollusca]|uniref:Uncharacterized protein n=1 Tax=Leucogyrophana mollusca TaxID=85980 RepID=A0ACB8BZT3_9AGAM|nr:hypothetical protein BV22DRAFT_78419 [Leucogyrophana mollusca]